MNGKEEQAFKDAQNEALKALQVFVQKYSDFTKHIKPSTWNQIRSHVEELREIRQLIYYAEMITDSERRLSWVQDELTKDIEWQNT